MRAARRDLPALTRLWQACFGDTEAEVRAFWQALFDCTPVYLRRAPDGSPAAWYTELELTPEELAQVRSMNLTACFELTTPASGTTQTSSASRTPARP